MGYFLYARKSQEDDARQVQSIEDQLRLGHELAQSLGLTIVDVLSEARSAKRPGRPVFNEMITRLEAGEAEGIIAWHPDRLSRNAVDAGVLIDLLDRHRLRDLKFHAYKFENTPEGKWMLNIVLGQSKYQVDKMAVDVRRGLASKVRQGHFPQAAPPGYRNNLLTHTIEADPERFELLQKAFQQVASGHFSAMQVLDTLNNEQGFRTLKRARTGGGPLSRAAFYRLLTNPFYTGLMLYKGELHQGQHPPMITQREFEAIGRHLRRGGKIIRQKREFDFTGLMYCQNCGCQITAIHKTKYFPGTNKTRSYTYYHCSNRKGGCTKRGMTQSAVERQVKSLLDRVTLHPQVARWCLDPAQRWHEDESGFNHAALETLRKALDGAERKKSNLIDARLSDPSLFSDQEFKEHKEALQNEINALKQDIKRGEERLAEVWQSVENIFDFAVNAKHHFETGMTSLRRQIAASLGVHYSFTPEKLEIVPHPLLVPFLQFEPAEIGSENKKDGTLDAVRPSWLALRESVLNRLREHETGFPEVRWEGWISPPARGSGRPIQAPLPPPGESRRSGATPGFFGSP